VPYFEDAKTGSEVWIFAEKVNIVAADDTLLNSGVLTEAGLVMVKGTVRSVVQELQRERDEGKWPLGLAQSLLAQ
jgi:hypothetical protein